MNFLFLYLAISALVAGWTGWHIRQKLDKFDWAYHKTKIWLALVFRTTFWPLMLIFKPAELLWPKFSFRNGSFGIDFAKTARDRAQFMKSPPPCSATIIYRARNDIGENTNSLFYFSAACVERISRSINDERKNNLAGMAGTALWTSLRNENVIKPTELPSLLVNFDSICEDLIEHQHGQVHCLDCNKIYSVSEIMIQKEMLGSWLIGFYK